MKRITSKRLPFILLSFIFLTSCSDASSDPEVQALVKQSIDNMIFVEGGTFMMGHKRASGNAKTMHKVTLDSYYLSKYEVTWKESDIFSKSTGRELRDINSINTNRRRPQQPADFSLWQNAKGYCLWLGELSGLPFDLPTEAQWEYAARSRGKDVMYATDNGLLDIGRNINKRHPRVSRISAAYVGYHPPNPLGFYDMNGSILEFVNDWYDRHYYKKSPEKNPTGPKTGSEKVLRGGSNIGSPRFNTIYVRHKLKIKKEGAYRGGRCSVQLTTKHTTVDLKGKLSF